MKFKLNPDQQHVNSILEALKNNEIKFGKRFCPCSIIQNDDTVCKCKQCRETGECHCGLFIKDE